MDVLSAVRCSHAAHILTARGGIAWARKYGLRICLDLHAVPGSQNGYNHVRLDSSATLLTPCRPVDWACSAS